jgi:hypothetical protein
MFISFGDAKDEAYAASRPRGLLLADFPEDRICVSISEAAGVGVWYGRRRVQIRSWLMTFVETLDGFSPVA